LHFRREDGQTQFAQEINTIFARNRLAYELQANGEVRRILPPVLREALAALEFRTEDAELNRLLESARRRFSDADFHERYDALRDLWHAFERIKTLEPPHDVRRSSAALIARATEEPRLREVLDADMHDLTDIGNEFFIRHANAEQVRLETSEEIDYLFHRLFALIRFLLRRTGRGQ
jgi:archaeosine-15-forming tRNA-guanine transglycosylase